MAPSGASWSIRTPAASPASGGNGGITVSGLDVLGAASMTDDGVVGLAGTTHVSSSVGATAITAGAGTGGGAVSPDRSARIGDFAVAARGAPSILGLAFGFGLPSTFGLPSAVGLASAFGLASASGMGSAFRLGFGTFAAANGPVAGAPDT